MDYGKATLIICLTIFIVIGINAGIYVSLRRGTSISQIELLRKAAGQISQPWKKEDNALQELSRRVGELSSTVDSREDSQVENDH